MSIAREGGLLELSQAIKQAIGRPTPQQRELLGRLDRLTTRLRDSNFQIAVLGQFKRGKSTLLNAFLGHPLLGAGVLPLTAVPTFLTGSATMRVKLGYLSGAVETREVADLETLAKEIAAVTTEEENPCNAKRLLRVDVGVPGNPWLDEVTLVDTPGIGSTHAHNTDAAYAALPECDAALFVCSVDPPITEVEVAYLARICESVPQVIVVLNKADLVDSDDARKATEFLSSVIAEQAGSQVDRRVFAVSAKRALAARQAEDDGALTTSGLPSLERHVRAQLVARKRPMLDQSIAGKMADVASALAAEEAMLVKALSLPLADLDAKVATFEHAAIEFERERVAIADAFNGEWGRSIMRLDNLCDEADRRVREDLDAVIASTDRLETGNATIAAAMTEAFDREFKRLVSNVETEFDIAIKTQQERYWTLVLRVRETAGTLLDVAVPPLAPEDWFQLARVPHWSAERRQESMSSLTVEGLGRLLPAAWQRRRREKVHREAIGRARTRNVSELHWTIRQNIDDTFRRLLAASHDAIATAIASTSDLLTTCLERRRVEDVSLQLDLEHARRSERRLVKLSGLLASYPVSDRCR